MRILQINHLNAFRVAPSKIYRFVEFVGDIKPVELSRHLWDLWVRYLKLKVGVQRLERSTVKITYSRARELVRWLIDQCWRGPLYR